MNLYKGSQLFAVKTECVLKNKNKLHTKLYMQANKYKTDQWLNTHTWTTHENNHTKHLQLSITPRGIKLVYSSNTIAVTSVHRSPETPHAQSDPSAKKHLTMNLLLRCWGVEPGWNDFCMGVGLNPSTTTGATGSGRAVSSVPSAFVPITESAGAVDSLSVQF